MKNTLFSPFKIRLFFAVWVATLISNFGMQIHIMAAGWLMLQLDSSPLMVALVQVSASLPYMLFALLAGALSDIYDRRKIMLTAQLCSLIAAALLAYLTYHNFVSPWSLLVLVMVIATGSAFFTPTWAASVGVMVPRNVLPQAISLNAINFNLGRSFAPALGGMLITMFGIAWAFVLNTLSYLGIVAVLWSWKPKKKEVETNREPILWAVSMGLRYAMRTDHIRVVLMRTIICGIGAGAVWSLMPTLAKQHLNGDATTFTILLTALGVGSVCGGLLVSKIRDTMGIQSCSVLSQFIIALCIACLVVTDSLLICALSVGILGVAWMVFIPNMNASIQLASPDWIVGRLLALWQSAVYMSFAIGGLVWGWVASEFSLYFAFLLAALVTLLSCIYGIYKPMLGLSEVTSDNANLPGIITDFKRTDTGKLPIVVTCLYSVEDKDIPMFFEKMASLKLVRLRLGATSWALQQELENPGHWIERFVSKDWDDQQRRPKRYSNRDNEVRLAAAAFDKNESPKYTYMVIRDPGQPKSFPKPIVESQPPL